MPRTLAFLRAINVGGRTVSMKRLTGLFEDLGLEEVETFLASGNVIFKSKPGRRAALAGAIEARLKAALGFDVATFLRSDAEVAAVAAHRAFPAKQRAGAGALVVGFLAEPLSEARVKTLMELRTDSDDFHVNGTEIYWLCRTKQSDSEFSNALFERKLKVATTFRGINTIDRLARKYPA